MKSTRSLSYQQPQLQQHTHQIKCYLKLYQSNGLSSPESHPPANYQILDQNTLLRKAFTQKKQQYEMYPFTRVFSARISNKLMSKQVCFGDDLQEGINHTTITLVDSQTKRLLTTGSIQQHGIFLQYFLTVYENFSTTYYTAKSSLFLSLFSTVNNKPNQYIDLLNGQRYTFLSKKDVDSVSYKTFYQLKLSNLQEFLIALKIAIVRFHECCTDEDFIIFRLTVMNQDQFSDKKTIATGNVVVCHQDNKNTEVFLKQVENLITNPSPTGQTSKIKDHGSLFSCIEPYLRNGRLSFIQCFLNDYDHLESKLSQIKRIPSLFMSKSCHYRINKQQLPLENFLISREQKSAKQIVTQKSELSTITTLSTKELQKFREVFASYKIFVKQSIQKLGQFARLYKQVIDNREEFYQKQRFPVSLQIKEFQDLTFSIKSFYISKIYSLSQKFQMPSLENQSDKMMTIKHQIFLSLKSLTSMLAKKVINNSKRDPYQDMQSSNININNNSFSFFNNNNKSYITFENNQSRGDSIDQGEKSSQKFQKLTKILRLQLQSIKNNLKYIFGIDSKSLMKEVEQENVKQDRKMKKIKEKELEFTLDNLDFSKLFGQELITEMEKLMKNLITKRDSNKQSIAVGNITQNSTRDNVSLFVSPTRSNLSPPKQSNNRTIVLNQCQKNISKHISSHPTSQNKSKQKMKKLISESQNLEHTLMQVKKEQMNKHLQIKQEIQKFQEVKENLPSVNKSKVALRQTENCVYAKEEKNSKTRIQSEKENATGGGVVEVIYHPKKSKHKQTNEKTKHKYQLVYQTTIKPKKNTSNNDLSIKIAPSEPLSTINPHLPKKISSLLIKPNKSKLSPALNLPQIRRSLQKSLNIDPNLRQTIIHSPKNNRKHLMMKVVNNSIIDEGERKKDREVKRGENTEENKSFLPEIGLVGKRIEG